MIRVSIVGVGGYVGEELLKILSRHPSVKITGVYDKAAEEGIKGLKEIYPWFGSLNLQVLPLDAAKIAETSDVVFLAIPHGVAFEVVPSLMEAGVKVIDLSADFRIKDAAVYENWYKVNHTAKEYIKQAVYGLSEINNTAIKEASLIANPGCYPTSVLLGLAPAIKGGFVNADGIVIDSQSGISGAGRQIAQEYFEREHPNARAYGLGGTHRHIPEIEQELSTLFGETATIAFTPHIIPLERGMISTIYANLAGSSNVDEISRYYQKFYKDKPFVKFLADTSLPFTKRVQETNFCEITFAVDARTKKLIIVSAIDNLMKGASGQAVQNMNIMFGIKEAEGLI